MKHLPKAPSVVAALVALLGALSLVIACAPVLPQANDDPEAWWYLAMAAPTLFWSSGLVALTTWLGRHAATEGLRGAGPIVAVVSIVGGAFLGVVNSGSCFVLADYMEHGRANDPVGHFVLACVFGSPMGGGLGIAFGLAFAVVLSAGIAAAVGRSRDWVERLGIVAGPWMALVGLVGIVMARAPETLALQTGMAAAGVTWVAWAAIASVRRKRLLAAALDGTHPLYRVVELEKEPVAAHELGALVAIPLGSARSWLSESRQVAAGAFRASEELVPVCAVPRDGRATLRVLGRRALAGASLAITTAVFVAASLSAS